MPAAKTPRVRSPKASKKRQLKECDRCKIAKPFSEFPRHNLTLDGFGKACTGCVNWTGRGRPQTVGPKPKRRTIWITPSMWESWRRRTTAKGFRTISAYIRVTCNEVSKLKKKEMTALQKRPIFWNQEEPKIRKTFFTADDEWAHWGTAARIAGINKTSEFVRWCCSIRLTD